MKESQFDQLGDVLVIEPPHVSVPPANSTPWLVPALGVSSRCSTRSILRDTAAHLGEVDERDLARFAEVLRAAALRGAHIYTCGNGGSASTASHLACDLIMAPRGVKRIPARVHHLYDLATSSAIANDFGHEEIFAAPLRSLLSEGDVLLVISVSGSSPNVLRALAAAKEAGAITMALLGSDGGPALGMADECLHIPCPDLGVVESVHLAIVHGLASLMHDPDGRP